MQPTTRLPPLQRGAQEWRRRQQQRVPSDSRQPRLTCDHPAGPKRGAAAPAAGVLTRLLAAAPPVAVVWAMGATVPNAAPTGSVVPNGDGRSGTVAAAADAEDATKAPAAVAAGDGGGGDNSPKTSFVRELWRAHPTAARHLRRARAGRSPARLVWPSFFPSRVEIPSRYGARRLTTSHNPAFVPRYCP